jgi:hypothetical protein
MNAAAIIAAIAIAAIVIVLLALWAACVIAARNDEDR